MMLIKLSGKAYQVFKLLEAFVKKNGNITLKELEVRK